MKRFLITLLLLLSLISMNVQAQDNQSEWQKFKKRHGYGTQFSVQFDEYNPALSSPNTKHKEEASTWYEELGNFTKEYPAATIGIIVVMLLSSLGIVFICKSLSQLAYSRKRSYSKKSEAYIKLYFTCYKRMLKILKKQSIFCQENIEVETAALCYSIMNASLVYKNENYQEILSDLGNAIYKKLKKQLSDKPSDHINDRGKFYLFVPQLPDIHAVAVLNRPPENIDEQPHLKLTLVLLDCLLCPDCIRDYENAELGIYDIFKLVKLFESVVQPLSMEILLLNKTTYEMKV